MAIIDNLEIEVDDTIQFDDEFHEGIVIIEYENQLRNKFKSNSI